MRGVLYAAWEIVLLLVVAGIIGLLLGWVLTKWSVGGRARRAEKDAAAQREINAALREQNDTMARELALARSVVHDQEAELRAARARTSTADVEDVPHAGQREVTITSTEPLADVVRRTAGTGPRHDDDLKAIRGIGPKLERLLKDLGITSFEQIARLEPDDLAVVADALGSFPGRIERDDWVGSATRLHAETYGTPL